MWVTALERSRSRPARIDVYIDGERRLQVARSRIASYKLRPGQPIEPANLEAIAAAEAERAALDAAVALLARRPHSEREVRDRLARRKLPPDIVERTLAKLRRASLLDDAAFARAWTESRDRASPRGRRLLLQELRARGVPPDVAAPAAAHIDDAGAAYRAASRRAHSLVGLPYPAFRDRLGALLARRGFGWSICRATVERCWRETHEDDVPDADDAADAALPPARSHARWTGRAR